MSAPVMHSGIWAKRLLLELEEQGQETGKILRKAGVRRRALEGETPTLPLDQVIAVFQASALVTGDPSLALHLVQRQNVRDAGLIAYVAMSQPTLFDGLSAMARYYGVFTQGMAFDLDRLETEGRFSWRYLAPVSVKRRQLVEWSAAIFTLSAREATGMPLAIHRVRLSHPRRRDLGEFGQFFGGEVEFDTEENALYFTDAQLSLPIHSADERLAAVLRRCCEDALADIGQQASPLLVELERAMAERLSAGRTGIEEVAAAMGMSRRTLARRLREVNTTYTETLEGLRQALADRYLTDSDLSVSEIGYLLGYADTSTFSTAFRRWTGRSPGQVRAGA